MLDDGKKYIRMTLNDIEVGKPVRWDIYNGDREMIFAQGSVIATQAEAEAAIRKGWFRVYQEQDLGPGAAPSGNTRIGRSPLRGAILAQQQAATGAAPAAAGAASKRPDKPGVVSLDASRIQIGETIQLQGSADASLRFMVRLIGYAKNGSVIVTVPELNGGPVMLREGQAFVCRFFSGLSAYAFPTSVLRQTNVPYPHLHLSYPREVNVQEVRKSPRIDIDLISAISLPNGRGEAAGKLVDLSATGAGLRTKSDFLRKGETIQLKFKITVQGIDSVLVVPSEICSQRTDADNPMPHFYGLRFVELESATQFALTAFVYGRLIGEN